MESCPLCGARDLGSEPFCYLWSKARFPAARCRSCQFIFLSRQPTEAGFQALYGAQYFESDYHCGHEERSYFARESEESVPSSVLFDWLESVVDRGRILEVGCAGGYFLKAARDRGWSALGIEVSQEAASFAREKLGLDVRAGTLENAGLEESGFDAAYLGDVLEHVPRPRETLTSLHRVLRPGGALLVAGPITVNSLDRRLGLSVYRALGRIKTLRQPPYHLSEFTPASLRRALFDNGFRVHWVRQFKIPPVIKNTGKRARLEHLAKLSLDAPNWLVTKITGRLGDRVAVLASKE